MGGGTPSGEGVTSPFTEIYGFTGTSKGGRFQGKSTGGKRGRGQGFVLLAWIEFMAVFVLRVESGAQVRRDSCQKKKKTGRRGK